MSSKLAIVRLVDSKVTQFGRQKTRDDKEAKEKEMIRTQAKINLKGTSYTCTDDKYNIITTIGTIFAIWLATITYY